MSLQELGCEPEPGLAGAGGTDNTAIKFRALAGTADRVLVVRNSVPVRMMLFSNLGSVNGLMSFSVPQYYTKAGS